MPSPEGVNNDTQGSHLTHDDPRTTRDVLIVLNTYTPMR